MAIVYQKSKGLTDAELHSTYVHPHRREFGPYAAKRA